MPSKGKFVGCHISEQLNGLMDLYCRMYGIPKTQVIRTALVESFEFVWSDEKALETFLRKVSSYYQNLWNKVANLPKSRFPKFLEQTVRELKEKYKLSDENVKRITENLVE
jgi:hypothetical protein